MAFEVQRTQTDFLKRGGSAMRALDAMRQANPSPGWYEYPKLLTFPKGRKTIQRTTETIDKRSISWSEEVDDVETVLVGSAEEEERVLAGGRTNPAIEEERLGLLAKARTMGLHVDAGWTAVRLKRELGQKLDAEPNDEEAILRARIEKLERIKALRARVEALEAADATPGPDLPLPSFAPVEMSPEDRDVARLRGILDASGVTYDRRWGVMRLRAAVADIGLGQPPVESAAA